MQVAILGPLRLTGADGAELELSGTRLRVLLTRLALDAGRFVGAGALIDALWGDRPPVDASNALQSVVSRLRRALRVESAGLVESGSAGYRLVIGPDDVDAHRFEGLVVSGREALRAGRVAQGAEVLRAALALWRGPVLAGLDDAPFAGPVVSRLTELRVAAVEDQLAAEVELGGHVEAVARLRELVTAHPLRERAAGLLMRALSAAGRQAEALAEFERVRRALDDELGVEPGQALREQHLAVLRGERPAPPPTGRPAALTSFVGRDAELAEVTRLLTTARLVTLVGPGGAGKTRLAAEATVGSGRSWLVELARVRSDEDVPGAVLGALGGRDTRLIEAPTGAPQPPSPVLDRVAEVLAGQRGVLVLDNCEHVVAAAAELADALLARCPGLTVLATSREPLAITGEVVLGVGPLAVPAEGAPVEAVLAADAVRLFADRAEAAAPGFSTAEHVDEVAEVCRGLDGLPLAVELAAARLRSMTVRQVADRLDDRFRLLTGGNRTAMPRHRTLHAVVEWSWDLLDERERRLAARLSVFPAPAAESSVVAVGTGAGLPAEDVVYVLASLVEKSFVQVVPGQPGAEVRYRMLETVRAYAAERLGESGEAESVRVAFGRCVLTLLRAAEPHLRGHEQVHWLRRIEADHGNVLGALRAAVGAGDTEAAAALALGAMWYWMIGGHHREATNLISAVAAMPGDMPDAARVTLRALSLFNDSHGLPDRAVTIALRAELAAVDAMSGYPLLAVMEPMLAAFTGDVAGAWTAVGRAEAHPDPWARGMAELSRAFLLENAGDLLGAEAAATGALARFRDLGDRWGQAMAVGQVAERRSLLGDHAASIAATEEAVRLASELGAADELPGVIARMGVQRARAGDLAGGEQQLREALVLVADRGADDLSLLVRAWLATVLRLRGDLAGAEAEFATGLPHLAQLGDRAAQLRVMFATVGIQIATAAEDFPRARRWLTEATGDQVPVTDTPILSGVAEAVAVLCRAEGDPETAARLLGLTTATRGAPDLGNPELSALTAELDAALGQERRHEVYTAASELPRAEALTELLKVLSTVAEKADHRT
ncbi:BTAD domain-containing putative transcriptional regulator [Actinokineospora pegani]|uniref:BTAD domain-containing putative transcriptional regulator n=1 Tax=Actinokineospora pegani TaxID=2654637 RepID=UPI0012E9CB24|nr:BTAD domain-containing putative transcriptional regulator [Actinokineospora pegani]